MRKADNLTTIPCRCHEIWETLTSWNPLGLSRPVTGLLYRYCTIFDVLLTVHLSIFISVITNLMHKICFTISFISCLYMFRAHVLETCRGMKQTYCKAKFCASSWLITEIKTLYRFRTVFPPVISSYRLYVQLSNRYCSLLAS